MTDTEANDLRLFAAEVIARLYKAGQLDQLRLLEIQVKRSLEVAKAETGKVPSY